MASFRRRRLPSSSAVAVPPRATCTSSIAEVERRRGPRPARPGPPRRGCGPSWVAPVAARISRAVSWRRRARPARPPRPCRAPRAARRASAPSPSATISIASWRSSASSARAEGQLVLGPGLDGARPTAPLASRTRNRSWKAGRRPMMRSNERSTAARSSRSSVCASIAASVSTKHSIVAKEGEIIPAPLACAQSRTDPPEAPPRAHACFGPAVGRHDRLGEHCAAVRGERPAAPPDARDHGLALEADADHAGRGNADARRRRGRAPAAAVADHRRATAMPRSPSPTFALPLLTTTAAQPRAALPRRDTVTGARDDRVAGEQGGRGGVVAVAGQHARRRAAPRLDPAARPRPPGSRAAARPVRARRRPRARPPSASERSCPVLATGSPQALRLVEAQHHVEVLHGLPGGALPEVVDRREHQHRGRREPSVAWMRQMLVSRTSRTPGGPPPARRTARRRRRRGRAPRTSPAVRSRDGVT